MAIPKLQTDQTYTVGDYLAWPDNERWELIDGRPFLMSPAPSPDHQRIAFSLARQIANFLEETKAACEALISPIDVYLPDEGEKVEDSETVLQPDVVVVCDPEQITRRGIVGPPKWVIEVLSPSTSKRDQGDKRAVYERHGVAEYWLIHPQDRVVQIYRLGKDGGYGKSEVSDTAGSLDSQLFEGLTVDWDEVFAKVTPSE